VEAFRGAAESGLPYDLICMDILMPEMNGQEAIRQVRALEVERGILPTAGVKIIMTTSVDDMKEVVRSFEGLCDAYLVKPFSATELLHQLWSVRLV